MAGKYTDIIRIDAPSSAAQGERVDVTVRVKNIDTYWDHVIACVVEVDGLRFIDELQIIRSGETNSYSGAFLMAGGNVTIYAYTYYPEDTEWILDDTDEKDVALAEVFKGTINRKELEYDEAQDAIPVYNIPQGQRGLVHIWGRTDMDTPQRLGIHWKVEDPDGIEVEEYVDWAWGYYQPGRDHEFIGGRFALDKQGTYTIWVGLMMNYDDPEYVDTYSGNLCTVAAAVPESEFRGFGVAEYVTV
jgi:hypothetical protein